MSKMPMFYVQKKRRRQFFKHPSSFVRERRFTGKLDCKNCILKANGALDGRDWHAVKYFVKNHIDIGERGFLPLKSPPLMTTLNTLLKFNLNSCKDNKKQ